MLASAGAVCVGNARVSIAAPVQVLTAADVHVDGYPTVEAVRWMSEMISRETGGSLSFRVYHSGQLGRESDTVDLARFGALDITRVNFAALNNAFPETRAFSLPYVFDSTAHMRRVADGPVGREILKVFEKRGLIGLALYDSGSRCFYNTHRPITTPGDLRGLKFRVPPSDIFIALVRALGANPTPLSYGEVFSALQTRLIDGAENNWRSFHSSRQFEVARYWASTEHSYSPEALLMSKHQFDSLTSRQRELIVTAAAQSVSYMRGLWDRAEEESRSAVVRAGVKVTPVDRQAFVSATEPLVRSYVRSRDIQRLYKGIRDAA